MRDKKLNDAFIVYHYYSELESGGHESLFRWFEHHIKETGIDIYSEELSRILKEIGAHNYSMIEKKYCQKCESCTFP